MQEPPEQGSRGNGVVKYTSIEIEPDYSVKCVPADDSNKVIRFLLSQRVFGFPGSNGTVSSNLYHYFCNNHPLFSLFFCDKRNPFNQRQRWLVYYCLSSLAIFLSFIFINTDYVAAVAVCHAGCHRVLNSCVGGENDGKNYLEYTQRCGFFTPQAISVAIGVVLLPYGSLLRFFSVCSCLQGRTIFQMNFCGERMKSFLEYFGGIVMTTFVLLSTVLILYVVFGCWLTPENDWSIFLAFALSKLCSAFQWFFLAIPYFCLKFPLVSYLSGIAVVLRPCLHLPFSSSPFPPTPSPT